MSEKLQSRGWRGVSQPNCRGGRGQEKLILDSPQPLVSLVQTHWMGQQRGDVVAPWLSWSNLEPGSPEVQFGEVSQKCASRICREGKSQEPSSSTLLSFSEYTPLLPTTDSLPKIPNPSWPEVETSAEPAPGAAVGDANLLGKGAVWMDRA